MSDTHSHDGHRERLKERFEREGLTNFKEHEVLELVLFYAIPLKDTNQLAHDLIDKFGSIDRVFDADVEALTEVKGVGRHTAVMIHMIPQLLQYYAKKRFREKPKVDDCESLGRSMVARIGFMQHEVFAASAFDSNRCEIDFDIISEGTVTQTEIQLRRLVEFAVRTKASVIVVAHNHVHGTVMPSQADRDATRFICKGLGQIGVMVADHIIVSGESYHSFAMNNEMPI